MKNSKSHVALSRDLERERAAHQETRAQLEKHKKNLQKASLKLQRANERLENLLGQQEDAFQGVYENILDPYVVCDLDSKVLKMNHAAREYLGEPAEGDSLRLFDLVHPSDLAYTKNEFKRLVQNGSLKNYTSRIRNRKGTYRHIRVNASLIYDKKGHTRALHGVIRDITAQVTFNNRLDRQRIQLDTIVENSPLGIILSQGDQILRVNQAICDLLGYSPAQLIKLSVPQLVMAEDLPERDAWYAAGAPIREQPKTMERQLRRSDKSTVWARINSSLVTPENGKLPVVISLIEDLTQERALQQRLLETEGSLTTLVEQLKLGIVLENADGQVSFANEAFMGIFGSHYPARAIVGLTCEYLVKQTQGLLPDVDQFIRLKRQVVKGGEPRLNDELEFTDGRIIRRDYTPVYAGDKLQGHLWTYTDVTELKNHQFELQRENDKYRSLITNLELGIVEINPDLTYKWVNECFCKMVGLEPGRILGRKTREIVEFPDEDALKNRVRDRREGLSESYEIKVRIPNSGKSGWYHVSSVPYFSPAGSMEGIIAIFLDVTEKHTREAKMKRMLREVERSNREFEEYAHVVSHDLKSPLRRIHTLASWLLEKNRESACLQSLEWIEKIQENAEGMDELIDSILQLASIEGSNTEEELFSLHELIAELTSSMSIPKRVTVKNLVGKTMLKGQRVHFRQVFQNLISNAIKHNPETDLTIEVGCEKFPMGSTCSVSDNGKGIAPESQAQIFNMFHTLEQKKGSSGIGLSIVKKIVGLYGGELWVESQPGQGAAFKFTIPSASYD